MKAANLCCIIGVGMWFTRLSMAQTAPQELPIEAQAAVVSLADQAVSAIRNKDSDYLSTLVDSRGIYVGFDVEKKTAARFRKELSDKSGAYCIIFGGCRTRKGESSRPGPSLRELLIAQPVTVSLQPVEGQPEETCVVVKRRKYPAEVVFTLFFRRVKDRWLLQQIEFN